MENVTDWSEDGSPPLQTPNTLETPARVIDEPLLETDTTLLYVSVVNPEIWYLIIVSLLIPKKFLPGQVTVPALVPPVIVTLSVILNPDGTNLWRTVSATNEVLIPEDIEFEDWKTDLISWVLNALTLTILLEYSVVSFIKICSPAINEPEVWMSVNSVPAAPRSTYPDALLLTPLTYEVAGHWLEFKLWLMVSFV